MTTPNHEVSDAEQPDESTKESVADKQEQIRDQEEAVSESQDELEIGSLDFPEQIAFKPFKPSITFSGNDADETKELVEEIAEDMLHFMERLKNIEATQESLAYQMDRLHQALQENGRHQVVELNKLRRELLEDRKAMAVRNTFNAIVPSLDSLLMMRNGIFASDENKQIRAQLHAVIGSLKNILQSLGYVEFEVEEGAVFNPSQMECLGYAEGDPNVVIEVVRTGYKVKNVIIRPCGVLISQPSENNQ